MSKQTALIIALLSLIGCHSNPGDGSSMGDGSSIGTDGGGTDSQSCSQVGATQACCGSGVRTCSLVGEFSAWGPCQTPGGEVLSCCMTGEFGSCDGGMPGEDGGPLGDAGSPGDAARPGDMATPPPALCMPGGANNEPKILVGYAPANGQSVGAGGQIKVWVNDEGAPIIAPGEVVDVTTGSITMPGDRTATASDGYLWEPALYISPQSAENGGTPHFPQLIKGSYNNTTMKGAGILVAGMDPPPAGSVLSSTYTGEDIWNVDSLGLSPGAYTAEFVIHDGDRDRGVGCITIIIN